MLITEKEFAKILNIKQNSLSHIRKRGEVDFYEKIGRLYYYDYDKCLEFSKTFTKGHTVYDVDMNYFKQINTENKAYFLGLLYADGGNTGKSVSLSLEQKDKHILESFASDLRTNQPIKTYKTKTTTYCRIDISRKQMIEDLKLLGIVERKSLILDFPDFIPRDLMKHFIRGYFDGDGHLTWNKNNYYTTNIGFTSTLNFLEKLKIETSNLNIHMGIYDISSLDTRNKATKRLIISGWNQCQIFLDYMYNGSSIFLNRKFEKYNYIKNIKNQIAMGTFIDG